jgi:hypothetical protein
MGVPLGCYRTFPLASVWFLQFSRLIPFPTINARVVFIHARAAGLRARAPLPCPAYCAVATGQSGRTPCSEYNCSSTHAMVVTTLTLAELRHLARHGPKRIPATLSLAAACLSASSVQRCRKLCAPGAPTRQCRQPNKNGHVGRYHRTTSTR